MNVCDSCPVCVCDRKLCVCPCISALSRTCAPVCVGEGGRGVYAVKVPEKSQKLCVRDADRCFNQVDCLPASGLFERQPFYCWSALPMSLRRQQTMRSVSEGRICL